jgi:hypothetical protein
MMPFPVDPLTDVVRTITKFHAAGFAASKKANCFAINESHFSEIDGHLAVFLLKQVSKRLHIFSVNPATHAQHRYVVFTHKSLYSEGHWDGLRQSLSICRSFWRLQQLPRAFDFVIANVDPFVMY